MGLLDMAFESAKAIPVFGQVVVAPFRKEYEKRQQAEHEERVKTELGRSGALTAETLAAALEMSADVSAIREGLEVLAQQLNELAADEAVADEAPKISTFPLPYAPEYLIQELNVLLPADGDSSVFDKALSESGWEGDDRTMRIHDRVTAFVRSATGQVKKFTAVLEQLFRARPDSDPLARAVEYLRRGED